MYNTNNVRHDDKIIRCHNAQHENWCTENPLVQCYVLQCGHYYYIANNNQPNHVHYVQAVLHDLYFTIRYYEAMFS